MKEGGVEVEVVFGVAKGKSKLELVVGRRTSAVVCIIAGGCCRRRSNHGFHFSTGQTRQPAMIRQTCSMFPSILAVFPFLGNPPANL